MSQPHGTSFRPRATNELALLQCGQNLRNAAAPRSRSFLRCADGAVETRQPAVAQPAGCCVSNKYGATWGSRGELRCPLERASPHAHVLSDHVHRASCARVCRSRPAPEASSMAHVAQITGRAIMASSHDRGRFSGSFDRDEQRSTLVASCVRSGGCGGCTCPLLPSSDAG